MSAKLILFVLVAFVGWVIWEQDTGRFNTFVMLADMLPYGDKMIHFSVMGSMALLANMALKHGSISFVGFPVFTGSLIIVVAATIEEFSQLNFPTRNFDLIDLMMNYSGIALFSWAGFVYQQQRTKRLQARSMA